MRKLLISALVIALYASTASAMSPFAPGGPFGDVVPGEFIRFLQVDMKLRGNYESGVAPLVVGTIETTTWPIAKLPHSGGIGTACEAHIEMMKFMFRQINRQLIRQYERHHETSVEDIWNMDENLGEYELSNSENLLDDFVANYLPIAYGPTREEQYASFNMAMTLDTYFALLYEVKQLVVERKGLTCAEVADLEEKLTGDDLPLLQEFLAKFRDGFGASFAEVLP